MRKRDLVVWHVEALWSDSGKDWAVTVGSALTRDEARVEMAYWKCSNPCDRFRLGKYRRVGGKR